MLYKMLRTFDGFFGIFRYLWSPMMLLMRVHFGWLFFAAGYAKFGAIAQTTAFFSGLHIPFPEYAVYLVAFVEMVGGLFLLLGFMSRLVAFPLFITMLVAFLTADSGAVLSVGPELVTWFGNLFSWNIVASSPFGGLIGATPFYYMLTTLLVLMGGPGIFSLDKLIRSRVER